jgi:hypothetical protein
MLQDPVHFIKCDPHMVKYELFTPDATPTLPEGISGLGDFTCYKVTDKVHALPAGLWDSDILSTYEFMNVADGLFVRIQSPMSIVMESVFSIKDGGDGKLEMWEVVNIACSRLLIGVIKGQCEGNWKSIHQNMLAVLKA